MVPPPCRSSRPMVSIARPNDCMFAAALSKRSLAMASDRRDARGRGAVSRSESYRSIGRLVDTTRIANAKLPELRQQQIADEPHERAAELARIRSLLELPAAIPLVRRRPRPAVGPLRGVPWALIWERSILKLELSY
jgi:hypothetical protein